MHTVEEAGTEHVSATPMVRQEAEKQLRARINLRLSMPISKWCRYTKTATDDNSINGQFYSGRTEREMWVWSQCRVIHFLNQLIYGPPLSVSLRSQPIANTNGTDC